MDDDVDTAIGAASVEQLREDFAAALFLLCRASEWFYHGDGIHYVEAMSELVDRYVTTEDDG